MRVTWLRTSRNETTDAQSIAAAATTIPACMAPTKDCCIASRTTRPAPAAPSAAADEPARAVMRPAARAGIPAFLAMGAGWAITLAPMSTAVMGSVEPGRAGLASAAANTSRELGGVLGVASLGALTTAVFNRALLAHLAQAGIPAGPAARVIARAGSSPAAGGSTGAGPLVRDAIQQSFAQAMHAGIVAAAAAMLSASVVSYLLVRSHVTHANTG